MNFFSSLFTAWLVEATWYGSLAVILVLILTPPVRRLLGARAAQLLWLLVLLRLLAPVFPTSPWPWNRLPAGSWPDGPAVAGKATLQATVEEGLSSSVPAGNPTGPRPWLLILWAAGAGAMAGLSVMRTWRTARLVRGAADIGNDARILAALGSLPGCSSRLRICETDKLKSPALCGVLRSVIFLPVGWAETLTYEELRCVLAHEMGHLRRGDILWRWAFLLARALHWFNPLVWWAERAARLDQEMACDEWVMQNAGVSTIQEYGEVLLKAAQVSSRHRLTSPVHAGMAESRSGLGNRIRHLARFRPHGRPALLASGVATVFLALLVGPAQSDPSSARPDAATIAPVSSPAIGPVNLEIEAKFVEVSLKDAAQILEGGSGGETVSAILSAEAFPRLLKTLGELKGADILSTPRVTTKPGQRVVVEIAREFRFPSGFQSSPNAKSGNASPSDFETQSVGIKLKAEPSVAANRDTTQGLTPHITKFETRSVGVTLEVEPSIAANRDITLGLTPRITEFEGFINYGKPIEVTKISGTDAVAADLPAGDQPIMQPVFNVRSVSSSVTVKDGQTVMIGGLSGRESASVDSFIAGGKTNGKKLEKALYLFVTPRIVSPDHPSADRPKEGTQTP